MELVDLIFLGIALGIDCLVVSFSQGMIFISKRRINSLRLAIVMGLFQGLMPVIGYVGIDKIYNWIMTYKKWVVFGIFLVLGFHFISEALVQEKREQIQCIGFKCLVGLGVATSIDALVSGVTLRLTHTNIIESIFVIGLISFIMSMIGFWGGNIFKHIKSEYLQILGGLILIALAIKTVI